MSVLLSRDIHVFPFGNSRSNDPNARVLNEQNITTLVNKLTDKSNYVIDYTSNVIEFVIHGYYVKANVSSLINDDLSNLYAKIDITTAEAATSTISPPNYYYLNGGDSGDTSTFTSVDFSTTKPEGNYILHLLERDSSNNFVVPQVSKLKHNAEAIQAVLNTTADIDANINLEDDLNYLQDYCDDLSHKKVSKLRTVGAANTTTDLNTVQESGFYKISSDTNATYTNAFTNPAGGQLIVCYGGGDTITQLGFAHPFRKTDKSDNIPVMFVRTCRWLNSDNETWTPWTQVDVGGVKQVQTVSEKALPLLIAADKNVNDGDVYIDSEDLDQTVRSCVYKNTNIVAVPSSGEIQATTFTATVAEGEGFKGLASSATRLQTECTFTITDDGKNTISNLTKFDGTQDVTLSIDSASTTSRGVVQVGNNIDVKEGTISVAVAADDDYGVIKTYGSDDVTVDNANRNYGVKLNTNKSHKDKAYVSVPLASDSFAGLVRSSTTGTTANRDYNVQVNTDGTMKVNVPWYDTDTTYDLSAPVSKSNGEVTIDLTAEGSGSGTDSVKITGSGATTVTSNSSGEIIVTSTDKHHTRRYTKGLQISDGQSVDSLFVPAATADTLGVVKVSAVRSSEVSSTTGGETNDRYYGVEKDKNNKLFVNVPWTNSNDSYMTKVNPTGSGSFSLNRAAGTTVGENSIAIGTDCEATHDNSIAIGYNLKTSTKNQIVLGKYNESDDSALLIVGSGGVTVDGNVWSLNRFTMTSDKTRDNGGTFIIQRNTNEGYTSQLEVTSGQTKRGIALRNSGTGDLSCGLYFVDIQENGAHTFKPLLTVEHREAVRISKPVIIGDYNETENNNALFVVSNETDDEPKNVFEVLEDGTAVAYTFNAKSDARLKENFESLTTQSSILNLPTYKFDFKSGLKNQIGCKAQDLQKICPEIVSEGNDGYLSIQESKIVYLLLEEVKKLRQEMDELKRS